MMVPQEWKRGVAALLALLTVGCVPGTTVPQSGAAGDPAEDVWDPLIGPPMTRVGACLDPSASVDPAFLAAGIDEFAAAIRQATTPPEATAGAGDGWDPVGGLDMVVRRVSGASFGSSVDEVIREVIPGVPGLVPKPDPADVETYAQRNQQWRQAEVAVREARNEAQAARDAVLAGLATMPLDADGSEIGGCITAVRDSFPTGEATVVVLSDLDQTGSPQFRGDYSHLRVLVVTNCRDAAVCDTRERDWAGVFDQLGAKATFTTLGRFGAELTDIITGG